MKAKILIMVIMITLTSVIGGSLSAQEVIPADSTHLLSKEQVQALKYTKKYICTDESNFKLPLEVNYLLGDTIADVNYEIKPIWGESYFLTKDSIVLIIPLQKDSINLLQCQLRVYKVEDNIYQERIETVLGSYYHEEQFTGSIVYSHINGLFISIYNFYKGECVEIINNKINPLDLFSGTRSEKSRIISGNNDLSRKALKRCYEAKSKLIYGQLMKDKISPFPHLNPRLSNKQPAKRK